MGGDVILAFGGKKLAELGDLPAAVPAQIPPRAHTFSPVGPSKNRMTPVNRPTASRVPETKTFRRLSLKEIFSSNVLSLRMTNLYL